ncbi:hypothetical protein [Paenibacillus phocaensis]|uniref:hypothetical protein n=1 Tax=Paenibacillus phocaensis TaxID=1776378 RepID=UPI000839BE97|nr:hypothetical protein [Paenibacillus phocaensis]
MMKLLKYDIKQNANTVLGLIAVLVIVQGLLSMAGRLRQWDTGAILVLTIVLYLAAAIILLVQVCKTFAYNIKAYHRRLLPLHPVWTIASSLLFSWLVALVMAILISVHAALYVRTGQMPFDLIQIRVSGIKDIALIAFSLLWIYTLLVLTIFLSIAIGASVSIRGKAGTWVGIVTFFVIQNGLSWLEDLLFGESDTAILKFGTLHVGSSEEISSGTAKAVQLIPLGPFLLEAAVAALMVYATTYLLKKRIEI